VIMIDLSGLLQLQGKSGCDMWNMIFIFR
jgi:hypothetical protein